MPRKKTESPGRRRLLEISVKTFVDDYAYRIDLDADYQREKIWSTKQQEDLIDSILREIDIPKIYLAEVAASECEQFQFECIDGKQRMSTLLRFLRPESNEEQPLQVQFLERKYTYRQLEKAHPSMARRIDKFKLSFVIYPPLEDAYVRDIFRKLQLGLRLNSGELLKTRTGTIRDFIYKEIGNSGPFLRNTNLSEKRFSRPFTLAQICLNSFAKAKPEGKFVRTRLEDIEDFFDENHDLNRADSNLRRITAVLKLMDKGFGASASTISSRAAAVSAYLFVEELHVTDRDDEIPWFCKFFIELLSEVAANMELLSRYRKPSNSTLMEGFQKYILQASVESYSIKRRHDYLRLAFEYYSASDTRGRMLGNK